MTTSSFLYQYFLLSPFPNQHVRLLKQEHKHSGSSSTHWYAWMYSATCATKTHTHIYWLLCVSLSVKVKHHPSYGMHGARDYSHFSQLWPNCTGWLSYWRDSGGVLFAYKWQSLRLNLISPWLKECDQSVADRKDDDAKHATRLAKREMKDEGINQSYLPHPLTCNHRREGTWSIFIEKLNFWY